MYLEKVDMKKTKKKETHVDEPEDYVEETASTLTVPHATDIDKVIEELKSFQESLEPHIEDRKAFRDLFFKHARLVLKTYNN
jgi:hypothetical protein